MDFEEKRNGPHARMRAVPCLARLNARLALHSGHVSGCMRVQQQPAHRCRSRLTLRLPSTASGAKQTRLAFTCVAGLLDGSADRSMDERYIFRCVPLLVEYGAGHETQGREQGAMRSLGLDGVRTLPMQVLTGANSSTGEASNSRELEAGRSKPNIVTYKLLLLSLEFL